MKSFHNLPLNVAIDKQENVLVQSVCSSGKASGFASQTFQVMSQIGIDGFHRISLFLVRSHFVG